MAFGVLFTDALQVLERESSESQVAVIASHICMTRGSVIIYLNLKNIIVKNIFMA